MQSLAKLSSKQPIKIACIGGSIRSAVGRAHLTALRMDRKFDVVAGCFSRDRETNLQTAVEYGVPSERTYHTISELLQNESQKVDAALVISSTDQHKEHVELCLKHGLFTICEKSLTTSSRDIITLKECLRSGGFDVAVVYNYLGYPMLRELQHLIKIGKLGVIQQIQIEMPQEGFAKLRNDQSPYVPQSWRLRDFPSVAAVSLDLGVHIHSIVKYLTGLKPLELVAQSGSLGNFSEVVDNVNCLAKYENDLICNIWYGKVALGYSNGLRVRVFGEIGSAEWVQQFPEELHLSDVFGNRSILNRGSNSVIVASQPRYTRFKVGHPTGFIEALANYYWDIAELYQRRMESLPCSEFDIYGTDCALEGLRMMETIALSSKTGSWEKV